MLPAGTVLPVLYVTWLLCRLSERVTFGLRLREALGELGATLPCQTVAADVVVLVMTDVCAMGRASRDLESGDRFPARHRYLLAGCWFGNVHGIWLETAVAIADERTRRSVPDGNLHIETDVQYVTVRHLVFAPLDP